MQPGTKAETLRILQGRLTYADVLPLMAFTVKEWKKRQDRTEYWTQCVAAWGDIPVIVRSSALSEDTQESSQAGKYVSVANVSGAEAFLDAVDTVIHSFDDAEENNQVLVQPMLADVAACGVAFTVDPNTLGNYYVINYDESGSTSAVTSGNGQNSKLQYVFKGMEEGVGPEYIHRLCLTLKELEGVFGQDNLDVEFAVTGAGELYLL